MRLLTIAAALAVGLGNPASAQPNAARRDAYAAEMDFLMRAELCAGEIEPIRFIGLLMNQSRIRHFGPDWEGDATVAHTDTTIRALAARAVRNDTAHACFTAGWQLERHIRAHSPR